LCWRPRPATGDRAVRQEDPPIQFRSRAARYVAVIAAIVALLAVHRAIFRLVAAHTSLSVAILLGLAGAAAVAHLGLLGSLRVALRRDRRRKR